MRKKDYIKIAGVLREYRLNRDSGENFNILVSRFSQMLWNDNPKFKAEKFSGYIYSD